ncbi:MAG: sigma 54-interacting transcriptional regulator, partial [Deltaproteobacteria bacterium]|nr:sigma 54-interacting transcriptional regulator [Deltaproteobacteria bacterium]
MFDSIKVKDVPCHLPKFFSQMETISEYLHFFSGGIIEKAPILNEQGKIEGVVGPREIIAAFLKGSRLDTPLKEVMGQDFLCIDPNVPFGEALPMMIDGKGPLVVVDAGGTFVGMLNLKDLLATSVFAMERWKERLIQLLNSSYEGIIAIDKGSRIFAFNHIAEKIFGVSAQRAMGKLITEVIPNAELPNVLKAGKETLGNQVQINGKTLVANRSPIYVNGEIIGAVAIFQDITERQESLVELDDRKQMAGNLEMLLDNAYLGLILCDASGNILFLNRMYEELFEVKRKDAIGKHISEIIPNSRIPIVVKTGVPEIGWKYIWKGQTLIVNRYPLRKRGKVIGVMAHIIFKDLSELKEMAEKLDLLQSQVKFYEKEIHDAHLAKYTFNDIIGISERIEEVRQRAMAYAKSSLPILITGESGTGKELLAHAIHLASPRSNNILLKVNCAAIPMELLESELFGYEAGAFTGASQKGKIGKFELAHNGTILLDEIGDMPLPMQAKLLRVIEDKEVERVGGIKPKVVDFRIITATNKNLQDLVRKGLFRSDLFFRLQCSTISIPPLRERCDDIPELIRYYLADVCKNNLKPRVADEAMALLMRYPWPGNVRELRNVIYSAFQLLNGSDFLTTQHLPQYLLDYCSYRLIKNQPKGNDVFLKETLENCEREV